MTKLLQETFVKHLQDEVRRMKASREMEERYMVFEEMLEEREKEAERRLNELYSNLLDANRLEDLKKAMNDETFREELYEEYHID